ncbi:MAG: RNA 2',3'-cyclic phosphodiesterase [Bacteroidia bacterium]
MEKISKRLFVGIALPEAIKEKILLFEEEYATDFQWIGVENLHITVHFLGEMEVEILPNLCTMLEVICRRQPAFALQTEAYTFAPKGKSPRMIWLQWKKAEAFKDLVWAIENAFQQIEAHQNLRKSPIPHTTLIRFKKETHLPQMPLTRWNIKESLAVTELILWEALLTEKGAVYQQLAAFPLKIYYST